MDLSLGYLLIYLYFPHTHQNLFELLIHQLLLRPQYLLIHHHVCNFHHSHNLLYACHIYHDHGLLCSLCHHPSYHHLYDVCHHHGHDNHLCIHHAYGLFYLLYDHLCTLYYHHAYDPFYL